MNPSTRKVIAQVGGQSMTITMPYPSYPGGSPQSCFGSNGNYTCTVSGRTYQLTLTPSGDSLFVDIESSDDIFDRVLPALVNSAGNWERVDIGQYGMAIGQVVEKASYCQTCDLWASGFWDPNLSQGTRWNLGNLEGNYGNNGSGNMKLTQTVFYDPNDGGNRLTVRERLEIRVADTLWGAVPDHPNQPSAFAQDLAETVFVDIWGKDTAIDLTHLVQTLNRIAGEETRFYTNWALWGAAGHDALTPDSIWQTHNPPYPPNTAGFGSIERMQAFADVATASGFGSFRTYYSQIEETSPSFLDGLVSKRWNVNGNEVNSPKLFQVPTVAARQEQEISDLFATNAVYTDTLGGAYPSSPRDYDPAVADGLSMAANTGHRKTLANLLKSIHGGPVAGESLQFSHLLGEWVATGEYDLWNGRGRLMTPEYKLRRLHGLSTFHGLGLSYRFSNRNAEWNGTSWRQLADQDDYRATEILFGNGGYLYVADQLESAPWAYYLTEVLLVGQLQRYYALQEISEIEYHLSGSYTSGDWKTLEQLVEDTSSFSMVLDSGWDFGNNTPSQQSPEFERIRVTYANGLTVVVNRGSTNFPIVADGTQNLTLPPTGWAAWNNNLEVLAYSAWAPGTSQRVDFLEDNLAGVSYVDPRGTVFQAPDGQRVRRITQWRWQDGSWKVRLEADLDGAVPMVSLDGQRFPLHPTQRPTATSLATDFSQGLQGWRTLGGVLNATEVADGVELEIHTRDPKLITSPLAIDTESVPSLSVEMFFPTAPAGALTATMFFRREGDPQFVGTRAVTANVLAQSGWQTVTFAMNSHPDWDQATITQIRFDPLNNVHNLPYTLRVGEIFE